MGIEQLPERPHRLGALVFVAVAASLLSGCGPRDQEECRVEAAKEARNADALDVLLEACEIQFPATRTISGGYEYMGHPVAGPVPTKAELDEIEEARTALVRQVEDAVDAAVAAAEVDAAADVDADGSGGNFYGPRQSRSVLFGSDRGTVYAGAPSGYYIAEDGSLQPEQREQP